MSTYFSRSFIIPRTPKTINQINRTSATGSHSGENIHIQFQSITFVNFKTKNTRNNKVAKLIPKGEDEAFISKAIEADSKMETGARIVAPIPKSENDLVSAEDIKIIDSPKTIQSAQYGVSFSQESNATTDEGLADLVKDQKPSTPQTDVQVTQNSIEPDEKKFESGNDSQTNEQKRVGRPPKNPQLTIE